MQDQFNEFSNEPGCPKCGNKAISKVKYTWWGGVLGPRLLHHTKCDSCGYTFNSKTGKSNTAGIIIYSVVIFVVAFALYFFIRNM
jgi:transposase-like protein